MTARVESGSNAEQIRQLQFLNDNLKREKNEMEQKFREKTILLEAQIRDEKEKREKSERRAEKEKENSKRERDEKVVIKEMLQNEKEEKNQALQMQKYLEDRFYDVDKEKRKTEQALLHKSEEVKEANERFYESETVEKQEIERRRKLEKEIQRLNWENDQLKKEIKQIKNDFNDQVNQASDYEIKYQSEIQEKEALWKIVQDKEFQRQQIDVLRRNEQKEKEYIQKRADVAEKQVAELNEKLLDAQNEVSVQQEENEKEKEEKQHFQQYKIIDNQLNLLFQNHQKQLFLN
ncbi:MAG: hypothetical protein EZS28_031312 [Streblomastix strix]|uniref:Uncharacterized protein n=1 Tax=Streblomastix strix TaxID=222440 RepID=A0A5J4UT78_9EUKA|nr:MAG: hypothetical protein EZS28_031312 [Streblomastix strix]